MKQPEDIIAIHRNVPNVMVVTWVINNICDRSCAYCPPKLHNGSNHNYDWNLAREFWKELIDRYENIHVSIAGGEPTLSPHLKEAIDMIWDSGNTVGLTTNLTRKLRYFETITDQCSYIAASYHPSSPDPEFIDKVAAIQHQTPTTVRVMMDKDHWDNAVETYNQLCKLSKTRVEAVRILDWMNGANPHTYTPEQDLWLEQHAVTHEAAEPQPLTRIPKDFSVAFEHTDGSLEKPGDANSLISQNQTNFQGWQCSLGLESLFIHHTGRIRKANCDQGPPIGYIDQTQNIQWPTAPETCNQTVCHCVTDIMMTKHL